MNAIMKKLAGNNNPSRKTASDAFHQHVTVGSFEHQAASINQNTRYGTFASNHHQQPSMSFAGKKITAVSHHQSDAAKRMSVNLQSSYVNKVAASSSNNMYL